MSGGIFYIAKKTATPPGPTWVEHFDNSDWQSDLGSNTSWVTDHWQIDGADPFILVAAPGSDFYVDYRPTKIRITGTIGTPATVRLIDFLASPPGNIIASGTSAVSLEMDITFSGSDMIRLELDGYSTVTNIEFLE